MDANVRACLAYVVGRMSGAAGAGVFDHTQKQLLSISGVVSPQEVSIMDHGRSCRMTGTPESLFDHGVGSCISLQLSEGRFHGFDFGSGQHFNGWIEGEFNRSSQHLMFGGCDGYKEGPIRACEDEVTRTAAGIAPIGAPAVLAGDCRRMLKRRGSSVRWRITGGWYKMVSGVRGDASITSVAHCQYHMIQRRTLLNTCAAVALGTPRLSGLAQQSAKYPMNSTSLPPFEILGSLEPPDTFLEYAVEIVTRTPAPSGELFEEFFEELSGGSCSGLFTPDSATRESYFITAERQRSRRKDTFRFQGRMGGVDLRMFRVLCGLLTQAHHGGDEIASVRVDCGTGGGSRLPAARIMTGDAFPARAAHPPFPCDVLVDPDREKLRTLRVRSERSFDDTMFGVAKEALGSWYLLVATGGYQGDFAPIVSPIVGEGECYLVSPVQLEMTLPDCHAPQVALDALVNWAGWLHNAFTPVQSIELD